MARVVPNRHLEVGAITIVADALRRDGRKGLYHLRSRSPDPIQFNTLVVGTKLAPIP